MAACACGCGLDAGVIVRSRGDGYVAGAPRRFVRGHGRRGTRSYRVAAVKQYRNILLPDGKQISLHRLRAERALGHALPLGAVVHHADGSRSDDAPLVICQDQSYHQLLHARMRVRDAGGNPNTDAVCSTCRKAKHRSEFVGNSRRVFGVSETCRACYRAARG